MTMTNAQFQAAFALALSHGHYWAVKANPAVWEAARIAASYPRWRDGKASTRDRADEAAALAASESRANEYGESAAVAAARSASDAVWAAFDAKKNALAAVKAADETYTDVIGPQGPEDYEACLVIASTRDEQGWGGVELSHGDTVEHTTCTGATRWEIDSDGWVTIRRCSNDETVASATVSPSGRSYEIEPGGVAPGHAAAGRVPAGAWMRARSEKCPSAGFASGAGEEPGGTGSAGGILPRRILGAARRSRAGRPSRSGCCWSRTCGVLGQAGRVPGGLVSPSEAALEAART